MALLALGRFEEGWREYKWRWKSRQLSRALQGFFQTGVARRSRRRARATDPRRAGIRRHFAVLPLCAYGQGARFPCGNVGATALGAADSIS